jgi:3'-phosphoadenosine 5'-phosphosulfate sulfotransferase (PAPS reductase)/FAD synthetase
MKHIVGFSGGIDSQACARWVLSRYPSEDVILLNSDAGGNEHPMTTEFVAEYSEKVHPVITVEAKVSDLWKTEGFAETKALDGAEVLDFPRLMELKGPPTRKRRTCTEFLKLAPQRRWMSENLTDGDYMRYSGNRRDESEARKHTQFMAWDKYFDCDLCSPLFDWNKDQCFVEVKMNKEPINPLYSLGFERVGCAPCILSGKEDITRWAQRFPEMIDKLRGWEERTGYQFFQKGGMKVDEVVAWARTDYGGYQFNILKDLDIPSCESKYGLCD